MDAPMDSVLAALDDLYAEFLLNQPGLLICNGDDLTRAMERGVMWDEFLLSKGSQ